MIAKINGIQYVVNDGGRITERQDEAFDDGTIAIEIQDNNTPFQKEQLIELQRDNKTWLFYIQKDTVTYQDIDDNIFSHSLLFSELTIILTKIKTPIMKFTNSLLFTPKYTTFKDIALSALRKSFPELNTRQTTYKFTQRVLDALDRISARDIETQAGSVFSTLREIFIPIKGIPRMIDETTIDVTFPNEVTDTIEFNNFNKSSFKKELGSVVSGSYVQTTGVNIVNSGDHINSATFTNPPGNLLSPRAAKTVLDENDFVYEAVNPIKTVSKFDYVIEGEGIFDAKFFVVESKVYDALKTDGFTSGTSLRYRQNCVRFDFGTNKIIGFGDVFESAIPTFQKVVWKEMLKSARYTGPIPDFRDLLVDMQIVPTLKDIVIKVPKESVENIKIESGYEINQARSIVSLDQLGQVLAVDVDKTGNTSFDYDVRVNASMDDIFELGSLDSLENSIIAVRTLELYSNNIVASYNLYEDFAAINDLLDKRIEFSRQYNIPEQGLADDRNVVLSDYIVATLDTSLNPEESYLKQLGLERCLDTFRGTSVQAINSVVLTAAEEELSIRVPVSSGGHDRGMNFYFGFDDVAFAGSAIFEELDNPITTNNGIRYSDIDGTLRKLSLQYGERITGNKISARKRAEIYPRVDTEELDNNILIQVGDFVQEASGGTDLGGPSIEKAFLTNESSRATIQLNSLSTSVTFAFDLVSINQPLTGTIELVIYDEFDTLLEFREYTNTGDLDPIDQIETFPVSIEETFILAGINQFKYQLRIKDGDPVARDSKWNLTRARVVTAGITPARLVGDKYLDLDKDAGENLKVNAMMLGVPYNTKEARETLGEIIWGSSFFKQNALVGGFEFSTKVFISDEPYRKDDDLFVKGIESNALISTSTSLVGNFPKGKLEIVNLNIQAGQSWAIADSNGRLYIAVNPPKAGGVATNRVDFLPTHKRFGIDYPYLP